LAATLGLSIALTPAIVANGYIRFASCKHKLNEVEHVNTSTTDNMLSHGQTVQLTMYEAYPSGGGCLEGVGSITG
jgi:hypothetical protein